LSLNELDKALARRGEMIGAVLIVGGPEVVPYHQLPNPVDDQDVDVPSDNPYSTRDENYFIPEWPVGRIPGGAGTNHKPILDFLYRTSANHRKNSKKAYRENRWKDRFYHWWKDLLSPVRRSYGYSAAIWQDASLSVFDPIGEKRAMIISPPYSSRNGKGQVSKNGGKQVKLPRSNLAYFNLHGLVDSAEWYGQTDPLHPQEGPDYPVALSPGDIGRNGRRNTKQPPRVVFSEACYGGNILGKGIDDAIVLKFLSAGTQSVIGSTVMAYGSVNPPLIAADLLGKVFWSLLKEGMPSGEAFKQAKILLVDEMNCRQGFLDGEDQKTLISFTLYGDPLEKPFSGWKGPRTINRTLERGDIDLVCDRVEDFHITDEVPVEVISNVKSVVSRYLPGMEGADMSYCTEKGGCDSKNHVCPTSLLGRKKKKSSKRPVRRVVTLSKRFEYQDRQHPYYARLTMNAQGKVVKMVVSR
jgi:hypothetical protein